MVDPTPYRISIHDWPGAQALLDTVPPESADWRAVITSALSSGKAIGFPAGVYRIGSLQSGQSAGVYVNADVPIDVECAKGARFVAASSVFSGIRASLFQLQAATAPDQYGHLQSGSLVKTPLITFKWSGGELDATSLTGTVSQGLTLLDISQYYMPEVCGVRFNGGFETPAGTSIGSGKVDTGLGVHGCVSGRYHSNDYIGCFDSGVYLSGTRQTATATLAATGTNAAQLTLSAAWAPAYANSPTTVLRANDYVGIVARKPVSASPAITLVNGQNVQINLASSGLSTGDRVYIGGATEIPTAGDPFKVSGEYSVVAVAGSYFTIDLSAVGTGNGGGSGAYVELRSLAGASVYGKFKVSADPIGSTVNIVAPGVTQTSTWTYTVTNGRSDNLDFGLPGDDQVSASRFFRCSNMVSAKRNERLITVTRNIGFQCGNGVAGGSIEDPLSEGKRFCIDHNVFFKMQGFPITLTGSRDDIVAYNRIINYGRLISDDGANPTPVSGAIAAIDLRSCDNPTVVGNVVKQEDTWKYATDSAIGVLLTADQQYKSGPQYAKVTDNVFQGIYKALGEYSPTNHSDFDGNINIGVLSSNRVEGSLHLGLPPVGFTPVLDAGGTAVSLTVAHATYTIRDGWLEFAIYLSSPTTLTGINTAAALTITGMPRPAAFDDAAFSLVTRGLASSSQNADLMASMPNGLSYINLYRRASGATSALTAAALTMSSKLTIVGSYFVGQP